MVWIFPAAPPVFNDLTPLAPMKRSRVQSWTHDSLADRLAREFNHNGQGLAPNSV
jgi:hypothetical protein